MEVPPSSPPDLGGPVEIAHRVWWVGSLLDDDEFQCHTYLVEQGDQSVLIDPGSALTFDAVRRKVNEVVGLEQVRWFVCSHQDPDITGALPRLDGLVERTDAAIVTHWRDEALIRHTGTRLAFWRIEEHGWELPLVDRALQFVFTPYLHFAGSFCTFDPVTGTLFSSDLFGGFTPGDQLIATSEEVFEAMRAFHEHYMPAREALVHTLGQLRELPIRQIAPQHGCIIPEPLVEPIMDRLEQLDCGLFLLAREDPGLDWLLKARRTWREVLDVVVGEALFPAFADHLLLAVQRLLPVERIDYWAPTPEGHVLAFTADDRFEGRVATPPDEVDALLRSVPEAPDSCRVCGRVLLPLRAPGTAAPSGVAVLSVAPGTTIDPPTRRLLGEVAELLEVAVEREVLHRRLDLQRAELYERAIRDPLTGLHNRRYLADVAPQLLALDDRRPAPSLALVMLDLDHFKDVNDTYGHPAGDEVLRRLGEVLVGAVRGGDLVARYGGEEFAVMVSGVDADGAVASADRLREAVAGLRFEGALVSLRVTASAGVALRRRNENLVDLLGRADVALYEAKAAGRNRTSTVGRASPPVPLAGRAARRPSRGVSAPR